MAAKAKTRTSLDRNAWITAAIDVLAEHGIDGVRVEVLAKRCRVTKGSFYWHFKDRDELLSAVLAAWKQGRIEFVRRQMQAAPEHARAQLYRVIDLYSGAINRRGMQIELAIRDWARRDARAVAVVAQVDAARLAHTSGLFRACGLPRREATSRSLLLYAYTFGLSLMSYDRSKFGPLKTWIADYIAK